MDVKEAIIHYCNYQERSQQEVRNKLYELKCNRNEVENLIAELIGWGLVNEERYAKALARGKFHVKQWGKNKIIQRLKAQNISAYCIDRALAEIDMEEYSSLLRKLAENKWNSLKTERTIWHKKAKTLRFLQQRGFETDLVIDVINELAKSR